MTELRPNLSFSHDELLVRYLQDETEGKETLILTFSLPSPMNRRSILTMTVSPLGDPASQKLASGPFVNGWSPKSDMVPVRSGSNFELLEDSIIETAFSSCGRRSSFSEAIS